MGRQNKNSTSFLSLFYSIEIHIITTSKNAVFTRFLTIYFYWLRFIFEGGTKRTKIPPFKDGSLSLSNTLEFDFLSSHICYLRIFLFFMIFTRTEKILSKNTCLCDANKTEVFLRSHFDYQQRGFRV